MDFGYLLLQQNWNYTSLLKEKKSALLLRTAIIDKKTKACTLMYVWVISITAYNRMHTSARYHLDNRQKVIFSFLLFEIVFFFPSRFQIRRTARWKNWAVILEVSWCQFPRVVCMPYIIHMHCSMLIGTYTRTSTFMNSSSVRAT